MAIPKENRQQMINMMYIVLTALLALNVSAELLNAFALINRSLDASSNNIDFRNKAIYNNFAAKKEKEPTNAKLLYYEQKALEVQKISGELLKYITEVETELITLAEPETLPDGRVELKKKGDVELSSRFMVEGEDRGNLKGGKGYVLQQKIESTLEQLLNLTRTDHEGKPDTSGYKGLITELPMKIELDAAGKVTLKSTTDATDWVRESFYKIPAVAAQTMLTKFKSDIKTVEGEFATHMLKKAGQAEELAEDEIVFDKFAAKIVAPTSYVMLGETFEAEIFLAAFNSKSKNISITVNGQSLTVNSDGVANYKAAAGSVGEKPLSGTISVKNERTGVSTPYKLPDFKYTVAAPFATVNPTKMNVFYIGVDNPIEVSAAGVRASDLNVSMSAGSLSGSGGAYTVRVTQQGKVTVNVASRGRSLASAEFRVKMIPDPVAEVGGKAGGNIPAAEMRVQNGLAAVLKNFDFDARFDVVSYQVTYLAKREDLVSAQCNGPYFSDQVKGFQKAMKPGDTVYFEEVRVKGPDGTVRKIPGIVFKLV
jgi:gliding motility-associated protein GldM